MNVNSVNSQALYATYAIKTADAAVARASQRLSTGLRINSAADDPSGMAIANNLKTYIGSYNAALKNVNDGIAMNQVADKGLSSIYSNLSNMYTLALNSLGLSTSNPSSNSSSNSTLMDANNIAFQSYLTEITSLATETTYNGKALLALDSNSSDFSDASNKYTYEIQAGVSSSDSISLNYYLAQPDRIGDGGAIDISAEAIDSSKSTTNINTTLTALKSAMDAISANQAVVGAQANIMSARSDFVSGQIVNNTQAYGNIVNANMAEESANLASASIKRDAATAMLAQANTMNADIVEYLLKAYAS